MMWWDNRQSMHCASPYDEEMGLRDVRRATVFDDGEGAFGLSQEAIRDILAATSRVDDRCEKQVGTHISESALAATG